MNKNSIIPIILMVVGFTLTNYYYGDVGIIRASLIGGISGIVGVAINQLIDKIIRRTD